MHSRVVFYDQKGLSSAARGWWLMGLFGHDGAAVLDGGLPKWRREGRPVETGAPPPPAPGAFRPHFRPTRLRGIGDVLGNLEHAGRAGAGRARRRPLRRHRAGTARGHAQRAHSGLGQHARTPSCCTPDGTFRPPGELRARFAAAGVDGTRPVVTSCGSGVSACVLTLGLRLAGLPEAAVYDGSWSEWGAHPATPVETD